MMNTFGTRCPACLTAFKVHSDLLLLKNGYGTCGQCGGVFDMQVALFMLPPHSIKFVEHVTQVNHEYPVLSAIVMVEDQVLESNDTIKSAQPAVNLDTSINQLSSQSLAENISFHIEPTDSETSEQESKAQTQTTTPVIQPVKPVKPKKQWLFYTNLFLLLLLLVQTAAIFSREISQNIPQTKGLFEQLNLPTDSK